MAALLLIGATVLWKTVLADEEEPNPPHGTATPAGEWQIWDAQFAGRARWYILAVLCANPDECRVELVATADGGRSWQRMPLPAGLNTRAAHGPSLYVPHGADVVVVSDGTGAGFVSTDNGRHFAPLRWRALPGDAPPEAELTTDCGVAAQCPEDAAVVYAADYRDLSLRLLARQPDVGRPAAVTRGPSGTWYAYAITGRKVSLTQDAGANWRSLPTPAGWRPDNGEVVAPADTPPWLVATRETKGRTAVELARLDPAKGRFERVSVEGDEQPDAFGSAVARGDELFVVDSEGRVWKVSDRDHRWRRVSAPPVLILRLLPDGSLIGPGRAGLSLVRGLGDRWTVTAIPHS